MAWVCTACPYSTCSWCCNEFDDLDEAIEHLRKCHHWDIRRPHAIGESDSHGHCWYCFSCCTNWKDHRSYSSSEDMLRDISIAAMGVELPKRIHIIWKHNMGIVKTVTCRYLVGFLQQMGGEWLCCLDWSCLSLNLLYCCLFSFNIINCCC